MKIWGFKMFLLLPSWKPQFASVNKVVFCQQFTQNPTSTIHALKSQEWGFGENSARKALAAQTRKPELSAEHPCQSPVCQRTPVALVQGMEGTGGSWRLLWPVSIEWENSVLKIQGGKWWREMATASLQRHRQMPHPDPSTQACEHENTHMHTFLWCQCYNTN